MLVDRPLQIVLDAVDSDEHLIEVPLVTEPRLPSSQLVILGVPELRAPPAGRLVADHDTVFELRLVDFTDAARERTKNHTQWLMISTSWR